MLGGPGSAAEAGLRVPARCRWQLAQIGLVLLTGCMPSLSGRWAGITNYVVATWEERSLADCLAMRMPCFNASRYLPLPLEGTSGAEAQWRTKNFIPLTWVKPLVARWAHMLYSSLCFFVSFRAPRTSPRSPGPSRWWRGGQGDAISKGCAGRGQVQSRNTTSLNLAQTFSSEESIQLFCRDVVRMRYRCAGLQHQNHLA